MAHIGTFTAQGNSFAGTVRTLTLNVKVKFVPNDKESDNAPDYRIQAGGTYEIGAAWKKVSKARLMVCLRVAVVASGPLDSVKDVAATRSPAQRTTLHLAPRSGVVQIPRIKLSRG